MKNTGKTNKDEIVKKLSEEFDLETSENIRLMISILDKAEIIINKLKKMESYLDKYFPLGEINKKKTIIRRIV